jgi:hypothetical protein
MNRRGFLGLIAKLLAVGTAIGIDPTLLKPVAHFLFVDASAGPITIRLPAAMRFGKVFVIKKADPSANVVVVQSPDSIVLRFKNDTVVR